MQHLVDFYARVARIRSRLSGHPLAKGYLSGSRVKVDGKAFDADADWDVDLLAHQVSGREIIHLFCIFNDSRLHIQNQRKLGSDGAPPGRYFTVINKNVIESAHKNRIGLYVDDDGAGLHLAALHLDHFFLGSRAPVGLGALSFGLCAITALRVGLAHITLIGAGGAGYNPRHVGYKIWPKFGFDGNVEMGEVNGHPHVSNCRSIQDILAVDSAWWDAHGSQRWMTFDLAPASRSWDKLLDYLQSKFCGGQPCPAPPA